MSDNMENQIAYLVLRRERDDAWSAIDSHIKMINAFDPPPTEELRQKYFDLWAEYETINHHLAMIEKLAFQSARAVALAHE